MLNTIHQLRFILIALGLTFLAACSHAPVQTDVANSAATATDGDHSTILLVSLEDGSIVRQTVALDADICIKSLDSTVTNCLTQGEAIMNNLGQIVGYEMHPETIELQGLN